MEDINPTLATARQRRRHEEQEQAAAVLGAHARTVAECWTIPRIWNGQTVVVIASGPSLTCRQVRHAALVSLQGRCKAIAVNDAVFVAWWADWLHACDRKWWNWHIQRAQHFRGIKTSLADDLPPPWGVSRLKDAGKMGFEPDPEKGIRNGGNGGYQAVHAAVHAGAKRILLLGFDMRAAGVDGGHFFGAHPDRIESNYGLTMLPAFAALAPELQDHGVEVINCTPESAMKCFPMRRIEEVLPL